MKFGASAKIVKTEGRTVPLETVNLTGTAINDLFVHPRKLWLFYQPIESRSVLAVCFENVLSL